MYVNYYWHWESVLPKDVCELVIKSNDWSQAEKAQIYTKGDKASEIKETTRVTDICWQDQSSMIGCIAQTYIGYANLNAGWNFDVTGVERVQIGRYDVGSHYDWHIDAGVPKDGFQRKLSATILLNDHNEFEGGGLEFKGVDDQPKLKQGSIVVFPATVEHRVLPVTSGTRYSAVTWAIGFPFK
jgi:PKHD-type hydroxylase